MRILDAAAVREAIGYDLAIDALRRAFREGDPAATPLRSVVETPAGTLLTMPAASAEAVGVKLVTLTPANPVAGRPLLHAVYVLFDGRTQAPLAVLDGGALTALRTSAVSALATRYLARPRSTRLVVFGAGVQAEAHVAAMRAVLPIEHVTIVGRDAATATALADAVRADGVEATLGDAGTVAHADVVCTCTT
ncbi:MAG TPA: ornithine cyclodeaminase family protein, partial [Actinomycetota bacterium]|nr:ornithine cyclodeaminase family protein [Actinomycetota bacterium]